MNQNHSRRHLFIKSSLKVTRGHHWPKILFLRMSPNRSRSGSSNGSKLKRTPSTTSLPVNNKNWIRMNKNLSSQIGLCAPDSPTVSRVKGHNRQASTGSLEFSERNHGKKKKLEIFLFEKYFSHISWLSVFTQFSWCNKWVRCWAEFFP